MIIIIISIIIIIISTNTINYCDNQAYEKLNENGAADIDLEIITLPW